MESCVEVNDFLRRYLLRGAISSRKSWEPAGRALYDFFSFLQAHELDWKDVERKEEKSLLAAYRDYSLRSINLKRTTVRQRVRYVCEFYSYALKQGWINALPFDYETRQFKGKRGFLAHLGKSGITKIVADVMPKVHSVLPQYLTVNQLKKLLESAENIHHHFIMKLALGSGLRKSELATFPRAYVFDPDLAGRTEKNIGIYLDPDDGHGIKTKGNKPRTIYISRKLMKDLNHYATYFRCERLIKYGSKNKALFLNKFGESFSHDGKSIDRIVREAGNKVGIKVWTHLLRHTYATLTLVALQNNKDQNRIEPLVFLQRQLGHSSIETTMIYLHLVNQLADEAVLSYSDEFGDIL